MVIKDKNARCNEPGGGDQLASTTINIDGNTYPHPNHINEWVDDTKLWPNVTSGHIVCYLIKSKACDLRQAEAYKSMDSYNYVQSGWVGQVLCHKLSEEIVCVKGEVRPSQAINKKPWIAWACVKNTGQVMTAGCDCMAGKARVCSHIGAVLWKIDMAVQRGLTGLTCTDAATTWNMGTKRNVEPALINDISFRLQCSSEQPGTTMKSRPTRRIKHFGSREALLNHVKSSPFQDLFHIKGTLLEATVWATRTKMEEETNRKDADTSSPQSAHSPEKVVLTADCARISPGQVAAYEITLDRPLCHLNLASMIAKGHEDQHRVLQNLKITVAASRDIEAATKKQRDCGEWFLHRKGRITASIFKEVCRSKKQNCSSLLDKIFNIKHISSPAIQYGIENEQLAKSRALTAFKAQHVNGRLDDCGLMIPPEYPYLGCSPDGIFYCDCHSPALLEVKCLYSLRNVHPTDLVQAGQSKSDFCLDATGALKATHRYYYQVQAQLHLNLVGSTMCYLYLHVDKGGRLMGVEKEEGFMDTHVKALESFFETIVLPKL